MALVLSVERPGTNMDRLQKMKNKSVLLGMLAT
jgi:hypothetical protein